MRSIGDIFCAAVVVVTLSACASTTIKAPSQLPPEPEFRTISQRPVIEKYSDGTFRVTAEFVERATQQEVYLKKIKEWKYENGLGD